MGATGRVIDGDLKFEASQKIPSVSCSRFAELIGLRGIYVDEPNASVPLAASFGKRHSRSPRS